MEVIPEQWFSALQLLPKDFRKVLMGQVSSTNHLASTWRVRMKEEQSIKEEGGNGEGDQKIRKRKHCNSLNHICNHFQSIYTRTDLLELYRGKIYLVWECLFFVTLKPKDPGSNKRFGEPGLDSPQLTSCLRIKWWTGDASYNTSKMTSKDIRMERHAKTTR